MVELRLRGIAFAGQFARAVKCLLRQNRGGLGPLIGGLARRDDLGACTRINVCPLGVGDDLRSQRLLQFGQSFGIVDPNQDGAGCDVLPANDGNFPNPAVDACGEIEPCRIDLALNEERFWP